MTNFDSIKRKTTEEMADFLVQMVHCGVCTGEYDCAKCKQTTIKFLSRRQGLMMIRDIIKELPSEKLANLIYDNFYDCCQCCADRRESCCAERNYCIDKITEWLDQEIKEE